MTAAVDIELSALDALDRLVAEFERSNPRLEGARQWLAYQRELRTRPREFIFAKTPAGAWRLGWVDAWVDVHYGSDGMDVLQLAVIQRGAPVRVDSLTPGGAAQKITRARQVVRKHNLQLARLLKDVRVENGCARYLAEPEAPRIHTSVST